MTDELVIPAPSDYHVHLRQAPITRAVAPAHAWAGRVLVMPNTTPPVRSGLAAGWYSIECFDALGGRADVVSTIKLTPDTTPDAIREAAEHRVVAAKLYPAGVTTNSDDGIPASWLVNPVPSQLADVFDAMSDVGMVLCCHGEMPGYPTFGHPADRDTKTRMFCLWLDTQLVRFPGLRIVLEHISTSDEVAWVEQWRHNFPGRAAATITPHHLAMTVEDVVGEKLRPHNFCKPVLKHQHDRFVLRRAAVEGSEFFLGTDSAPHPVGAKECADGCAGCFNAHAALGTVAEVFETVMPKLADCDGEAIGRLIKFTSGNGDAFYRRGRTNRRVRLTKKPYEVPVWCQDAETSGRPYNWFRPWRAGETLAWSWEDLT